LLVGIAVLATGAELLRGATPDRRQEQFKKEFTASGGGTSTVTVILYRHHKVSANHAFRPGELDAHGIAAILGDLDRMLSH
jgi:hypothetical protein